MHIKELFSLKDRVAVVTGGAGWLGFEMSKALAEAGANVVIGSRDIANCEKKAKIISKDNPEAIGIEVDVTNPDSIEKLVEKVINKFKKIDILVNNAASGSLDFKKKIDKGNVKACLEDMTMEEWNEIVQGCLTSVFLCSKIIGKEMLERNSGNIINIASMYGVVAPDQRIYGDSRLNSPGVYTASKSGVISFTRYLAAYWAKYNIRVNCISPGGILRNQPKDFVKRYIEKVPLGRMGNKTEINGAVVYLASDASSYVTGHNLIVDGGWTIW